MGQDVILPWSRLAFFPLGLCTLFCSNTNKALTAEEALADLTVDWMRSNLPPRARAWPLEIAQAHGKTSTTNSEGDPWR